MTDLRKAAEMALEALDYEAREEPESIWKEERDALRQALAQPAHPYKGIADYTNQVTNGRMRIDPVTGDVCIGTPS